MVFKLKKLLKKIIRLTQDPVIKVYDGFGDQQEIIIYGHVLKNGPLPRVSYRQNVVVNALALFRLFMVRPLRFVEVRLDWEGEQHVAHTDNEGFFRFEWTPVVPVSPGWHAATVSYLHELHGEKKLLAGSCKVFIPHALQYSFISDIDDTFLISHSKTVLKRLRVLVTRNSRSRKAFDDVVRHYQLLSQAHTEGKDPNPFFYVSSSEWNLYDYLKEFCRSQHMPQGIFLLSQLKRLKDLAQTGQNKHRTKYFRIARVLKSFPDHKYVLLGDNSQEDPAIYFTVVKDFPGKIKAVYIRRVHEGKAPQTEMIMEQIKAFGVSCCFFRHSNQAIDHSVSIGLIPAGLLKKHQD